MLKMYFPVTLRLGVIIPYYQSVCSPSPPLILLAVDSYPYL